MNDLERLRKVINWLIFSEKAKNESDLAEKCGYRKSSFSAIVNGKVPLADKFVNSISELDENLNKVWIKEGGAMFYQDVVLKGKTKTPSEESSKGVTNDRLRLLASLKTTTDFLQKVADSLETSDDDKGDRLLQEIAAHGHPDSRPGPKRRAAHPGNNK